MAQAPAVDPGCVKTRIDDMILGDLLGGSMTRFVVGHDRSQSTLFPRLDDDVGDDNPVRAIDVFGDELDRVRRPIQMHQAEGGI